MKFKFEITDFKNDEAIKDPEELTSRCLRNIANQIDMGKVFGNINDINGNKIGTWEFTEI